MKIRQIRNATLRIDYGGSCFLTDPWLAPKGAMGTFAGTGYRVCDPRQNEYPMPLCELPIPLASVLQGVEAYLITHVHPDHIDMERDGTVGKTLDKKVACFVQSMEDAHVLVASGFQDVTVLYENSSFGDVSLVKTPGRHGTKIPCGPSCGIILKARGEKTLYIAGDTIWYDAVARTIATYRPEVIVLNACAAALLDEGRLIMDDADVESVYHAAPHATIIVSHMDNVAHATLTRKSIKEKLQARGIWNKVLMPDDGEEYTL